MTDKSTELPDDKEPTSTLEVAGERLLSAEQFHRFTDVPAVFVWLDYIQNRNTRRAYQSDLEAFTGFCDIETLMSCGSSHGPI